MGVYNLLRYHVIPPLFLIVFTLLIQVLVFLGNPWQKEFHPFGTISSAFAWKSVFVFYFWAYLSLRVPAKTFNGPPTPTGVIPVYSANGTQYYVVSMTLYLILLYLRPEIAVWIYDDFSAIASVLSVTALILCVALVVKGFLAPERMEQTFREKPLPYLFYSGMEMHPRLLGVDVKQYTNCRVGMLGWALLVVTFAVAEAQKSGRMSLAAGPLVNAFLTDLYLLKFFYWETGYFNTLDITLDRAGYYLCWGCLCWVFYTLPAYLMVGYTSKVSDFEATVILLFGLASLALNYKVDHEKELFKKTSGRCDIWGKPSAFVNVKYTDSNGVLRHSRLLTSGFWGLSRHFNYVFELSLALAWSLPGRFGAPALAFSYVAFLFVLLVHRCFRDEEKCQKKYGPGWNDYCKEVPYRMIPGIF